MVAALLALLYPLRSLTVARPAAPAMAPTAAAAPARVHLQLTSTAVPFGFVVTHLGTVVWRGKAAASPVDIEMSLPFPTEGVDLALEANWPSGQTAAVKLSLTRGDDEPLAQTAWGDGNVSEVFTFK